MDYRWKSGTRCKLDAQLVGIEFERLQSDHDGIIRPEHVVDAARPKSAPLHEHFEWNNVAAAEQYRQVQARYLLRCLCIEIKQEFDDKPLIVRNLVNIDDSELGGVYVDIQTAMSDEQWRAQVIRDVVRRLRETQATLQKYEYLADSFCEAAKSVQTALDLVSV